MTESDTEFSKREREFLIAMFEQGKAERELKDAERALANAQLRARGAYADYLASRGIK